MLVVDVFRSPVSFAAVLGASWPRVIIAAAMAFVLGAVGIGMLRSIGGKTPKNAPLPEPELVPELLRIIYWCEECGTEVLLLRKGSDAPPRHCGEAMVRREEVSRN
jgi:hypothetical protein